MNPRDELRRAREEAGMSQRDLARAADMPQSTIARYESEDGAEPSVSRWLKLLWLCGYIVKIVKRRK